MIKKIAIIILCLGIVIVRAIIPELNFDWISLVLVSVVIIVLYNVDIVEKLDRLKKVKLGQFEIELEEKLKELSKNADQKFEERSETLRNNPSISGPPETVKSFKEIEALEKVYKVIDKPESALVLLAVEIEKVIRDIYLRNNPKERRIPLSPRVLINDLYTQGLLDKEMMDIIQDFWNIRNKVVHGHDLQFTDSQKVEMLDIGFKIYRILKTIEVELDSDGTKVTIIE
ncbi:hypothetical protein [Phaeodactylibacter xiamenensis]|uniref:hypothetical protein n=1 Tax=Phaeodactylibacter xiamenensis TaxID=1524460 RepID=UPI003CCBC699